MDKVFAFGGPKNWNADKKQSIDLIDRIILDGNYIHTCYDYGGHLQFVRDAAIRNNKKLKLILKCYLNYPDINSIRRRSLYEQIYRVKKILNVENEIIIQISSINSSRDFFVSNLNKFLNLMFNDFSIKTILLESFPASEKFIKQAIIRMKEAQISSGLGNIIQLGVTSYENNSLIGFTQEMRNFITKNSLLFAPMRVMGSKMNSKEIMEAKAKLKLDMQYAGFFRAITSVSNINQYKDLMNFSNQNLSVFRKSEVLFLNHKNTCRKDARTPYIPLYKGHITATFARFRYLLAAIFRNLIYITQGKRSISTITYIYPPGFL